MGGQQLWRELRKPCSRALPRPLTHEAGLQTTAISSRPPPTHHSPPPLQSPSSPGLFVVARRHGRSHAVLPLVGRSVGGRQVGGRVPALLLKHGQQRRQEEMVAVDALPGGGDLGEGDKGGVKCGHRRTTRCQAGPGALRTAHLFGQQRHQRAVPLAQQAQVVLPARHFQAGVRSVVAQRVGDAAGRREAAAERRRRRWQSVSDGGDRCILCICMSGQPQESERASRTGPGRLARLSLARPPLLGRLSPPF